MNALNSLLVMAGLLLIVLFSLIAVWALRPSQASRKRVKTDLKKIRKKVIDED